MTAVRELLTPEQVADYLQVNKETVYRYIREGKLMASKLGRSYRVSRESLDILLLVTRARPDIHLREYTREEIDRFLEADRLDEDAQEVVRRFGTGAGSVGG